MDLDNFEKAKMLMVAPPYSFAPYPLAQSKQTTANLQALNKVGYKAAHYYLTGKKAKDLDKLVEDGLKEYEKGETISASSMGEALEIYGKKKHK